MARAPGRYEKELGASKPFDPKIALQEFVHFRPSVHITWFLRRRTEPGEVHGNLGSLLDFEFRQNSIIPHEPAERWARVV